MTVLAAYGSTQALPCVQFRRWQSDLMWLFQESESRLGRRSNFGSFLSMIEGGRGTAVPADLVEEPDVALNDVLTHPTFLAARRARPLLKRLGGVPATTQTMLRVIYGGYPVIGLEAFGLLAPLVSSTQSARRFHLRSQTLASLDVWLVRLSSKILGVVKARGNGRVRGSPTASEKDILIHATILEEAREIVRDALREFDRAGGV